MAPYFLLLAVAALFSFVSIATGRGKLTMYIGDVGKTEGKNMCIRAFFLMLFFLLACRDVSVGSDTIAYRYYFLKYSRISLKDALVYVNDGLFMFLNWLMASITNQNFQIYLAVVSAITIYPIAKLYMEDQSHGYLQVVLFANMANFVMMFSGIRQAIAISIGVFAFQYVRQRKLKKFLLCVVAAVGFHMSSFVLLIMYPLYHIRIRKRYFWCIVPIVALVLVFNRQIFSFLIKILVFLVPRYAYHGGAEQTGAYAMLILFVLFTFFAYVVPDERKMTTELIGMRNYLLLSALVQCFAPVGYTAMRINYYFIPFIPALMGRLMNIPDARYKNVMKLAEAVICIFFTGWFVLSIIRAEGTTDLLRTVPYTSFWGE